MEKLVKLEQQIKMLESNQTIFPEEIVHAKQVIKEELVTTMQGFAKWGRVRHNMAESLGITTV